MRYDVDHAGREAGLLGDLGDQQAGIDGRELGWLDDDRVARGDRRERGAPREDVRAVPRCEADHDAERPPDSDRVGAGDVGLQHLAFGQVNPTGGLLQGVGDESLLELGEQQRAAGLSREHVGDLVRAPLDDLGGLQQ
jgi:hypothetical protein